jgi:hypothetical protein
VLRPFLEQELLGGHHWKTECAALSTIDVIGLKFSNELHYEDQVKILVSTSASALPEIAHLTLGKTGEWKLRSLLFQCPACFGSGILSETELCSSCGAKGWGTVNF